MTRKKVNLAYITNDSKRKTTYKKRKNGLIKKIDEISTLCGIEACAIIFGPNDPQPEIWPSPWGVQKVMSRFMRMPDLEQSKKMVNQETFLKQRILKTQEQLKRQRNENKRKELTYLMFQCMNAGKIIDTVSMNQLSELSWLIDQNLKEIDRNINRISAVEVAENNVAEVVSGGLGEQANMDDALWNMNFNNNIIGDELPFGEVDVPSLWTTNPQV